jgi:hypothetical protein
MVPRHEADDADFVRIETAESAVFHEVVRVLMVALVADVRADIVKQGAVLEPLSLLLAQAVPCVQAVEDGEREPRDLLRMRRQIVAPLAELNHAAAPHVRVPLNGLDVPGVACDVVEHEPFTQREVTECNFVSAEALDDRLEEQGTGWGEIRPARIHVRDLQPFGERERRQPAREPRQRLGAHSQITHVVGRPLVRGERAE